MRTNTTVRTIRRWQNRDVAAHANVSRATAQRLIRRMVLDGVLALHGKSWYGRVDDVDAWLLGRWPAEVAHGDDK